MTDDGRCDDCGEILQKRDYERGECGVCGFPIEEE